MANEVRFLGPGEGGYMPFAEISDTRQQQVYAALGEFLDGLLRQGDQLPEDAVALVTLDRRHVVAKPFTTRLPDNLTGIS